MSVCRLRESLSEHPGVLMPGTKERSSEKGGTYFSRRMRWAMPCFSCLYDCDIPFYSPTILIFADRTDLSQTSIEVKNCMV